ncbi:hypothetical protein JTE90_009678 [Oedothorax gibbosus]|uniref:Ion transport N-terminal domain-containing protein n=1 Tax=Oedothorax gibbosus TaxID=931172 RepID=A0AAV6VAF7_9ARAC|nr:hypothetical protein JTE90_009678 [Oedothorax gibbosus]
MFFFLCRGSEGTDGDSGKGPPRHQRLPSLRQANGRVRYPDTDQDEGGPRAQHQGPPRRQDSVKIHVVHDPTNTGTDSLVTAHDEDEDLVNDYISPEMNFNKEVVKGGKDGPSGEKDDVSLYGTPKEEIGPGIEATKPGFMRNQLEALFQPSDNKLAMKLFGSKKALMKERIRQKAPDTDIIRA